MAPRTKNVASALTEATGVLVGKRKAGQPVEAPGRVLHCPKCSVELVVKPKDPSRNLAVLHLDFTCPACGHETALGIG